MQTQSRGIRRPGILTISFDNSSVKLLFALSFSIVPQLMHISESREIRSVAF